MKAMTGFVALLLGQLMFMPSATAERESAEQSALRSQSARFQAMIEADMDTLGEYLAEDLTYSHTSGWVESKSGFLSTVESGVIDYVSVKPRDVEVRVYQDTAVIIGLSEMQGLIDGKPVSLTIRFLEVSRRVADTWQLVAWQAVRFTAE